MNLDDKTTGDLLSAISLLTTESDYFDSSYSTPKNWNEYSNTPVAAGMPKFTRQELEDALTAHEAERAAKDAVLASIEAGYPVEPEGYNLALGDNDRKAWSELLAMLKEGLELQQLVGTTQITIRDTAGTTQTITVDRFRQVFFEMGIYYKGLWDQL